MGEQALLTTKDLKRSLELPASFAEVHIPVRQHLGNGIFLLADGDLGVVYKIDGIYDELLSLRELEQKLYPLSKFMRQIALGIPGYAGLKNTVIQLICSQRQIKSPPIKGHEYSATTVGSILSMEERSLFSLGLVRRRYMVAVRYTPGLGETEVAKKFGVLKDLLEADEALGSAQVRRLEAAKNGFSDVLAGLEAEINGHHPITRLSVAQLLKYYGNVLNGGKDQKLIFPSDENIHQNIYNSRMKRDGTGIMLEDGTRIRPFVLSQLPAKFGLGKIRHFIDAIPTRNFDLVWCFSHGQRELGQELQAKMGWFSRSPAHKGKAADLMKFQENIDTLHPHGIQSVRLITYGLADMQVGQIQTLAMDYIGARFVPERQISAHMIGTSLPLCLSRTAHRVVGRSHPIRLENAMKFWPVFAGPSDKHGTRWRISRSFTPTRVDLFAGEGNRMTTVLGTSRSGKSVEMNGLILEFIKRFPNGLVRIIDKRTSYLKLADLLGGKIVGFSEEALQKSPYNPFALKDWDEDDIEGLYVLVATAMVQKNPGIHMTALHTEILRDALKIAFNNQLLSVKHAGSNVDEIDPHPIWENVLAQLPVAASNKEAAGVHGADEARADLAAWSVNLGPSGQYGFVFSRHEPRSNSTEGASFLVYDLDGIPDPVLQVLAAQMAFLKITRDLAKVPRSTPKLIVFEELGMLLHGDSDAQKLNEEFIQNVVKTCAKLNAQAISLTNSVADYADKPAGRTLWTMATQKIFLPMGEAMVADLTAKFPGEFTGTEVQILNSLEIERPMKRSQIYVKSDNSDAPYQGTMYSPLSVGMDALVTSSGSQVERYQQFRKAGMTPAEALAKMAEVYPYGKEKSHVEE